VCSIAQAPLQIPVDFRNPQNIVSPARGADSAYAARIDLCMTSVKMLSGSHAHKSPQKQLHPVVRIVTIRPAPFSGDAFPMKTLPLADCHEMTCSAKFPCSAASLLSPFRVARVSRLIGNSHTTVNSCGWQVNSTAPSPIGTGLNLEPKTLQTQETPLRKEWRFTVLRLSLASQKFVAGSCFRRYRFSPSRPVCLN
jgi:hypothetical protein